MRGILLLCLFGLVGCGDLKTATGGDPDASSSSSGGSSSGGSSSGGSSSGRDANASSSGSSGGGPYGALPSGYCCDKNEDCRKRHCEGGMCLDDCRSQSPCEYTDYTFTCDAPSPGDDGYCRPPGGFTCKPANTFQVGTKAIGGCCTATGDGEAGLECQGGLCIAIGSGPFVCTNACSKPQDCSGAFVCQQITGTRKECIPANASYTCQ